MQIEKGARFISELGLSKILEIRLQTVKLYMSNYQFNKFRRSAEPSKFDVFILNDEFKKVLEEYLKCKRVRHVIAKFDKFYKDLRKEVRNESISSL